MRRILLFVPFLLIPVASQGQTGDSDFHINLLITETSYSGCSDATFDWIDAAGCDDLESLPHPGSAFVWVVTSHEEGFPGGIGGAQFGIEYTADVTDWSLCTGGMEITEAGWPASGTGNAITWPSGCYFPPGRNAKIGFFRLSDGAAGEMTIVQDPRTDTIQYSECGGNVGHVICPQNVGAADLSVGTFPNCDDFTPPPAYNCVATDSECPIRITWSHGGEDVTGFKIVRNDSIVGRADGEAREFLDDVEQVGASFEYGVIAFNACGDAAPSNTDPGGTTPLNAASDCVASDDLCGYIRVTWTDNSDNETGFWVLRDLEFLQITGPNVTEFHDSTAVTGATYHYSIVATNECGDAQSSGTDRGEIKLPPTSAASCRASDDLCGLILITWTDQSDDETGFKVVRNDTLIAITDPDVIEYEDHEAEGGIPHDYWIVASNECGDAPPSNTNEGIMFGSTGLEAASECAASDSLCGIVRVTWIDNSDIETGFKIMRDSQLIATVDPDVTLYIDEAAAPGRDYSYTIVAFDDVCDAPPSNSDAGSNAFPAPASACAATETLCDRVDITWTDNSDDEHGFVIFREDEQIGTTPPDTTHFSDLTATPGVRYNYSVVAFNSCGDTYPSNTDFGLIQVAPAAPSECVAGDSACHAVRVIWLDNSDNETGFRVRRDDVEIAQVPSDTTVYRDDTAIEGIGYEYSIVATGDCGDSEPSNGDSGMVVTDPGSLAAPLLTSPPDGTIDQPTAGVLEWEATTGLHFMNLLITEPSYSGCSDPVFEWIDEEHCDDLTSDAVEGHAFVWVVASQVQDFPDGIGGAQFGIEYAAGVEGWSLCTGGMEIPEQGWPASGTGTAVTWPDGCYYPAGGNAKIGYFTLSDGASGHMRVTTDPRTGEAEYSNCDAINAPFLPGDLGSASLSMGTFPKCQGTLPAYYVVQLGRSCGQGPEEVVSSPRFEYIDLIPDTT